MTADVEDRYLEGDETENNPTSIYPMKMLLLPLLLSGFSSYSLISHFGAIEKAQTHLFLPSENAEIRVETITYAALSPL